MLTPRHPLLAELTRELQSDPSLSLSCVRVRTAGLPVGVHLIALLATSPAAGGEALLWASRAAEVANDEALQRELDLTSLGLRRAFSVNVAEAPRTLAWRLDRRGDLCSLREQLGEAAAGKLVAAMPSGTTQVLSEVARNIDEILADLERPVASLLDAAESASEDVAAAFARHAGFVGARLIAKREKELAAAGVGDSWRGMRESFTRKLDDSREFFRRLAGLQDHAHGAAREACTERVVCAAILEVLA